MSRRIRLALILVYLAGGTVAAADWPQWRGPNGTGTTDGNRFAGEVERHGERGLEGADRRSRCLDADCRRRSRVRDVAARVGRAARGQSSAAGAGRRRRGSGRASARRRARRRPRSREDHVPGGGVSSRSTAAGSGSIAWTRRGQMAGVHDKHNLASPSPVSDGQMVYAWFGTGQIVALDMNGKAGLAATPRDRDLAVRSDLGPQQLADAAWRLADPALRSRAGRRICWPSTSEPGSSCGEPIAARAACPTARRSSSIRRPDPS